MVKIITDSASDIDFQLAKESGVHIIPVEIIFEDKTYLSGEISNAQFYEMLENCKVLPKTSKITDVKFCEIFKPYANTGDDVLYFSMGAKLSGTYESALRAKEILNAKNIHVIDTDNITFGQGAIILETLRLIRQNMPLDKIFEKIEFFKKSVSVIAVIGDLKYLKLGGRLSGVAAIVGTLIKVKPVIRIKDGLVINVHKAIGMKKACEYIIEQAVNDRDENYPVYYAHANSPEKLNNFLETLNGRLPLPEKNGVFELGNTVGLHVGPDSIGLLYFKKINE